MSAKKSRFDGLDVAAMSAHLKRTMLGYKLANVYDGNALGVTGTASSSGGSGDNAKGVYMFKLADPSGGGGGGGAAAANNNAENKNNKGSEEEPTPTDGDKNAEQETTTTETTQHQDQKRAMLLIESGVRFHPTT